MTAGLICRARKQEHATLFYPEPAEFHSRFHLETLRCNSSKTINIVHCLKNDGKIYSIKHIHKAQSALTSRRWQRLQQHIQSYILIHKV